MTEFINLTPHDVVIIQHGDTTVFPKTGKMARVVMTSDMSEIVDELEVRQLEIGQVVNLPPEQEDVYYIVAMPVALSLKERRDIVSPDTDRAIRDEKGNIIGVPGFARY